MGLDAILILAVKVAVELAKGFFGRGSEMKYEVVDENKPVATGPDDAARLDELKRLHEDLK